MSGDARRARRCRREEFVEWLRREGERRYHDHHRFHVLMHEGKLTRPSCSTGC